jgi:tetratricopeptide (TPR) repeat protein
MPRLQKSLQTLAVLALIFSAGFLPFPIAGYWELNQAGLERDSLAAAPHEERAAKLLFWRSDLYEEAGWAYLKGQDYARADAAFQTSLDHHALSAGGWVAWGDSALKAGDEARAIEIWQAGLTQENHSAQIHRRLASVYWARTDYTRAENHLRVFSLDQPADGSAHFELGLILLARSPADALPELARAAQIDPSLDPKIQPLRVAIAKALLVDDQGYQLVVSGQALAALGEWRLAESAFERARAANPEYAEAWAWLAEARQQNGNSDVLPLLTHAIDLSPDSPTLRAMQGLYFQRQGELDRALAAYRYAALLEPDNVYWQISIASVIARQGDLVTAQVLYEQATQVYPQSAAAWHALALFTVEHEIQIEDVGLFAALQASSLAPDDPLIMDTLARAFYLTGQYDAAETIFLQAIARDPQNAVYQFHLGVLYLQVNKRSQAYVAFSRARDLDFNGPVGAQAQHVIDQYFP